MKEQRIRWITSELGTAPFRAVKPGDANHVLDVRGLLDRDGNSAEAIREIVQIGVERLNLGEKLAVCCEHGMSRSNAIAAGILAAHQGVPLDAAIRAVLDRTGEEGIRLEVLSSLRLALGASTQPVDEAREIRVLVTGASGMIGAALTAGSPPDGVASIHSLGAGELDLRRDAVPLDLMVREQGINALVHLAHPRISATNRAMGEAVAMTKNVLDVCRENSLRLVFASSCEIYSGYEGEKDVDESTPPRPATTLGLTKHLCEQLISAYRREWDLNATILRFPTVYGESQRRPAFLWNFADLARSNRPVRTHLTPSGPPSVNLLHVTDARRAVIAAISRAPDGDINLGDRQAYTSKQIAEWVIKACGSQSSIEHMRVDHCAHHVKIDIRAAKERLDWSPTVSLEAGIRDAIKSESNE